MKTSRTDKRWLRRAMLAAAVLLVGLVHPTTGTRAICPSMVFLDRPCALCGLTRSVSLACRGEFQESWAMHPLGLVVASGAILVLLVSLAALVCRRALRPTA